MDPVTPAVPPAVPLVSPDITGNTALGVPVESALGAPPAPPAAAPPAPAAQPPVVPSPAPLGAPPAAPPQTVPIDRLNEVINQRNGFEEKLGSVEDTLARLRTALGGAEPDPNDSSASREEFYTDPKAYLDTRLAKLSDATKNAYPVAQEAMDYNSTLNQFRALHGPNSEIETQIFDAIKTYGLQGTTDDQGRRSRGSAIRAGYKMVTGKNLNEVMRPSPKPDLLVPGGGGGGGGAAPTGDLESLYAMSPAQVQEFGPEKYVQAVTAAVAQQPT